MRYPFNPLQKSVDSLCFAQNDKMIVLGLWDDLDRSSSWLKADGWLKTES